MAAIVVTTRKFSNFCLLELYANLENSNKFQMNYILNQIQNRNSFDLGQNLSPWATAPVLLLSRPIWPSPPRPNSQPPPSSPQRAPPPPQPDARRLTPPSVPPYRAGPQPELHVAADNAQPHLPAQRPGVPVAHASPSQSASRCADRLRLPINPPSPLSWGCHGSNHR